MNIFRPHSVAVSEATRWMLSRIAQARNTSDADDGKASADSIAEEVLDGWLKASYPGLLPIWLEREAQEKKAVALIEAQDSSPGPGASG